MFVGILLCLSIARPLGVAIGTIFGGAAVVVGTVGTVWSLLAVGALSVAALVSFRALAVAALFAPLTLLRGCRLGILRGSISALLA